MKTIARWADLEPFGIDPLTGEACGLSYRILCDVTAKGRDVLQKCFGIRELPLPANWNGGSALDPHVGSILLAPEMLAAVAVFALLEHGCTEAWLCQNGAVIGVEPEDTSETIRLWRESLPGNIVRTFAYRGTAGDRNVHVMTGRIN